MTLLGYLKLRTAGVMATIIMFSNPVHQLAFMNALFGIAGGGIYQLLTYDERKPTLKYMLGDLLCSSVLGFASDVFLDTEPLQAVVYAIVAGFGGSVSFTGLVKKYRPAWLPKEDDSP